VDFELDDEQLALVRMVAEFLHKEMPSKRPDATAAQPGRAVLSACAQLGWFSLGVAEADGGAGASIIEEALLFREIGRSLAPGPFLPIVLGARVALAAGESTLARRIMEGEVIVALAQPVLGGDEVRVFDYDIADLLLVMEPTAARLVEKPQLRRLQCIDDLTTLGAGTVVAAPLVADVASPAALFDLGYVLLAAMASGIAEATRDATVAYLKVREQFGRLIGSFQALKHRAADMAVEAEAAWSLTVYAALSLADNDPTARLYCMAARALSHRAAASNSASNIQMHGAIGTTWEHDAHFYVKRLHVLGEQLEPVKATLRRLVSEPSPLRPA
jgi:alkylation response protein AidB-like acyl-CoA dehydrogenase